MSTTVSLITRTTLTTTTSKIIYNVYTGLYKREDSSLLSGPSLFDLVEQKDGKLRKDSKAVWSSTCTSWSSLLFLQKNNQHFDQLIAAGNAAGNALLNKTIVALVSQTAAIERAAGVIGIDSLNPDTADRLRPANLSSQLLCGLRAL